MYLVESGIVWGVVAKDVIAHDTINNYNIMYLFVDSIINCHYVHVIKEPASKNLSWQYKL